MSSILTWTPVSGWFSTEILQCTDEIVMLPLYCTWHSSLRPILISTSKKSTMRSFFDSLVPVQTNRPQGWPALDARRAGTAMLPTSASGR